MSLEFNYNLLFFVYLYKQYFADLGYQLFFFIAVDFLEGAKQAVKAVMERFPPPDLQKFKGLLGSRLYATIEEVIANVRTYSLN